MIKVETFEKDGTQVTALVYREQDTESYEIKINQENFEDWYLDIGVFSNVKDPRQTEQELSQFYYYTDSRSQNNTIQEYLNK